jgi:hypothetical protein
LAPSRKCVDAVHAEQAPANPVHATQCASAAAAVEQQAVLHVTGFAHHAGALHAAPGGSVG